MNFRDIRELSGLTQKEFSDKYRIPKRTLENWEQGSRQPPEYILYLLERVVNADNKSRD